MYFIKKNLIRLYLNKKVKYIYTKCRSSLITKDVLGKSFIVYNGKKWLRKDINNMYYLNKPIGSLKNLDTKKISTFKAKKKKTIVKKKTIIKKK